MKKWLKEYKAQWEVAVQKHESHNDSESIVKAKETVVKSIEKKLAELKKQSGSLHDFLEQGVYTIEIYMERSQVLSQRIAETESSLKAARDELNLELNRQRAKVEIIPKIEHVLDVYPKTEDPALRNQLLKSVLEVCTYKKTVRGHWSRPDSMRAFDLKLFPKIPKS